MRKTGRRVLVVGDGGREQALCEAIAKSPKSQECFRTDWTNAKKIISTAKRKDVCADLVVVGPEVPLVEGLADKLMIGHNIRTIGPSQAAARLEGDKIFGREVAAEARIVIPDYRVVRKESEAEQIIEEWGAPIVPKRFGLASGRGVTVAETVEEALAKTREYLLFGPVLLEQCLKGDELSVFFACDGTDAKYIGSACDKKRLLEGDRGPMTGGMGGWALPKEATPEFIEQIRSTMVLPTLAVMRKKKCPFRGILFIGLMLVKVGDKIVPHLLEYNVRWGNPEAQLILPLFDCDVMDYLLATLEDGMLAKLPPVRFKPCMTMCVMLANEDYPEKGSRIGEVTGIGPTLAAARADAYWQISGMEQEGKLQGMRYRRDIGLSALV